MNANDMIKRLETRRIVDIVSHFNVKSEEVMLGKLSLTIYLKVT